MKPITTQRLEKITTDYEGVMNRVIKAVKQLQDDERTAHLTAQLDAVEVTAFVLQRHLHALYGELAFIEVSKK